MTHTIYFLICLCICLLKSSSRAEDECERYLGDCFGCTNATQDCVFCSKSGICLSTTNSSVLYSCSRGRVIRDADRCFDCARYHKSCTACTGSIEAIDENCAWCSSSHLCGLLTSTVEFKCNSTIFIDEAQCGHEKTPIFNQSWFIIVIVLSAALCCCIPVVAIGVLVCWAKKIKKRRSKKYQKINSESNERYISIRTHKSSLSGGSTPGDSYQNGSRNSSQSSDSSPPAFGRDSSLNGTNAVSMQRQIQEQLKKEDDQQPLISV